MIPSFSGDLWIPLVFIVLVALIFSGRLGNKDRKNIENTERLEKKPKADDHIEPAPARKDNHSESHGSSGGHGGGHHGPSLLDRILSWGFIALMAFAAYWLYQHLHSLEGKPLVKHPVTVMTPGSHPVPVGQAPATLNLEQKNYCQVPNGEITIHQPSMLWTVVTLPRGGPGYEFCMDTLPNGKDVFAECSSSEDGEDWGICGRWSKRVRVRSAEKPLQTWFEPHVAQ